MKIGIVFDPKVGMRFYGIDEINDLISQGGRVTMMQNGDVIFSKIGEGEQAVRTVLAGCEIKAIIEMP